MTLSKMLWGMGLMVAGAASAAQPTGPVPVVSGPVVSSPAGPGCLTPTVPGTILPGTPGAPGAPSTPSTSSTMPSDVGSAAGLAASTVGAGGGEGGSGAIQSGAPNMIGDLGIKGYYRDRSLFGAGGTPSTRGTGTSQSPQASPIVANGQFRIIENESPRPQDRIFIAFNYFDDVGGVSNANAYDLYRSTFGFEKTFAEGNGSFGVRVPVLFRDGGQGKSVDGFGDITLIGKYAFLNDAESGSSIGGGLAVTIPLRELELLELDGTTTKDISTVLVQPYVGFLANSDRFYVQGFLSYVLPGNSTDTRLLSSDIGVGFKAYQNRGACLSAIIPTVEAHMVNPLNNRSVGNAIRGDAVVGFTDQVVITTGVHFGLWDRTYLTVAYGTPVTGSRLFEYEATVQLNVGF